MGQSHIQEVSADTTAHQCQKSTGKTVVKTKITHFIITLSVTAHKMKFTQ